MTPLTASVSSGPCPFSSEDDADSTDTSRWQSKRRKISAAFVPRRADSFRLSKPRVLMILDTTIMCSGNLCAICGLAVLRYKVQSVSCQSTMNGQKSPQSIVMYTKKGGPARGMFCPSFPEMPIIRRTQKRRQE